MFLELHNKYPQRVKREAFTVEAFISQVVEPEFVTSHRYAELIVDEIPKLHIGEALTALFRSRLKVDAKKLKYLVPELLSKLTSNQQQSYLAIVSEEFRTVVDEASIRSSLQMLTPELWPQLSERARHRIENKLILGIREGEVNEKGKTNQALATWSRSFLKSFTLKLEAASVLSEKLYWAEPAAGKYVAKFFMSILPEVATPGQTFEFVRALADCVRKNDENVRAALITHVRSYPVEWQNELAVLLEDHTDPNNPAVILDGGQPFLSSPANDLDDEIPF